LAGEQVAMNADIDRIEPAARQYKSRSKIRSAQQMLFFNSYQRTVDVCKMLF
jgi:hypothetical protein